jgi:hypothetical protein
MTSLTATMTGDFEDLRGPPALTATPARGRGKQVDHRARSAREAALAPGADMGRSGGGRTDSVVAPPWRYGVHPAADARLARYPAGTTRRIDIACQPADVALVGSKARPCLTTSPRS